MSKYQQLKQQLETMSDEEFKVLYNNYSSITALLRDYFNICTCDPRAQKLISTKCQQLNITRKSRKLQRVLCIENIDNIRYLASQCTSITELLHALHLQPIGGNFSTLRTFLSEHNLSLASGDLEPRYQPKKWTNDEVYCQDSLFDRRCLRKRVLRDKVIPYVCACCGNTGKWNNNPLNLQVDHINGIPNDNRLENLRWLCPNCHSQTDTYGGKNKPTSHKN